MNFSHLVALIFPFLLGGAVLGVVANLGRIYALSYCVQIIALFQFLFWSMAPHYGWRWYFLVSLSQVFVILMGHVTQAQGRGPMNALALIAILLNMVYLVSLHSLPRQGFFIGMTTIEAMQIATLIWHGELWSYLKLPARTTHRKDKPWMERVILD